MLLYASHVLSVLTLHNSVNRCLSVGLEPAPLAKKDNLISTISKPDN